MKTLTMILLALPLVTACTSGPSKRELDAEVDRLCAIDGGIRVYETVTLPAERFDEHGNVKIASKEFTKLLDEYYIDSKSIFIHEGNPRLMRSKYQVIRISDGKVMGESIRYSRSDGDIPGPWHGSSYSCPSLPLKLESSIFFKEK